jgi:ABC-type multidrug transport system ATPase subunit
VGLAATTFEIVQLMGAISRIMKNVRIVSLLQPPPETVALFDELVLLSEGKVIYSGPVDEVIHHFNSLGYDLPTRMDVADWLQVGSNSFLVYPLLASNACLLNRHYRQKTERNSYE